MAKSEYQKKLLDPRWQKKRLQVLERDQWMCQICCDSESTLHVHHKFYTKGEPWDIPLNGLVALCEVCHQEETDTLKDSQKELIEGFSKFGATSYQFSLLGELFSVAAERGIEMDGVGWAAIDQLLGGYLTSKDNFNQLKSYYLDSLSRIKKP